MVHNLSDHGHKGEKASLSIGETPWHNEGHVLNRGHHAEFDLETAMEFAGIDFEVGKSQHHVVINGEYKETSTHSTYREDTGEILGDVGDGYNVLQNHKAFAPLEKILSEGLATIETAGALGTGEIVWMMVKFQKDELLRRTREEDGAIEDTESALGEVDPYSLFLNSHNGRTSAQVKTTPIRVVCQNTLQLANRAGSQFNYKIRHTSNVEENYEKATNKLFSNVVAGFSSFSKHRKLFQNTTVPESVFQDEVLDEIAPVAHLEKKIQNNEGSKRTETCLEKKYEKRNEIKNRWINGEGHTGDQSAWEAYNGAVEYLDHSDKVYGTDGGRVDKMVGGSIESKKSNVFSNLLSFCS